MTSVPQFASLYVGDLHPDVTEAMLYEIFNSVGPVGSIRVCRDSTSRKSLGYGYVNYHSVTDAERAVESLNYSSIKGRACRIMWSQRDPSLRKNAVGNIFVKNLDRTIDNKALYDTFSLFGSILSCKVSCDANGKSRGYGFVHYETEDAAKQAIERVNGMLIGEKTVEVHPFRKRTERDSPADKFTNLYVKGCGKNFNEDKLKALFGPFGTIQSSSIMEDKTGRSFAFINYEGYEGAQAAVKELHGKDMRSDEEKDKQDPEEPAENYTLYVGKALTKAERAKALRAAQPAKAAPSRPQGVNLYIKNLDESVDDSALKEMFTPYGTITSVSSMKDADGKCRGFGFVCYGTPEEATKAVTEMHLKVIKGKPLYVGLAEKKEVRQERLRARYSPQGGKGGKGGKDGGGMGMGLMFGGKGGKGGMMGGAPAGGMGMFGAGMGAGPQQPMMGQPMMGMMGKGMPMGAGGAMAGKGAMPTGGPMGGAMPMMGMMGKGMPPPAMMGMMGGKGPIPGMGMMRPMMPNNPMMGMRPQGAPPTQPGVPPQMQQLQQMQMMQMHPGAPGPAAAQAPLTAAALAAAPVQVQKQMIGERLFPAVTKFQPKLAGKITGMMLEMDNSELLILLESEPQLKVKVEEAMRVLEGRS